jgi:hypothetical protein
VARIHSGRVHSCLRSANGVKQVCLEDLKKIRGGQLAPIWRAKSLRWYQMVGGSAESLLSFLWVTPFFINYLGSCVMGIARLELPTGFGASRCTPGGIWFRASDRSPALFATERYLNNRFPSPSLRLLDLFPGVRINVEISSWSGSIDQECDHQNGGDDEPKKRTVHGRRLASSYNGEQSGDVNYRLFKAFGLRAQRRLREGIDEGSFMTYYLNVYDN